MTVENVLFERRGRLGLITLNRHRVLNALSLSMVQAMDLRLRAWADDRSIACVAIRGAAGGRAFCAGADIRALHDLVKAGRSREAIQFWREEYRLNALIKAYPKPYVALIDGIVMGGGVGISLYASHRIACGEIQFAMPETGIGFFPDVGATYFLPRLPRGTGMWLALTSSRLDTLDAKRLGLIDRRVSAEQSERILQFLSEGVSPEEIVGPLEANLGSSEIDARLPDIATWFERDSVEAILLALDGASGANAAFAGEMAAAMRTKSPTSLKIAHRQLRLGCADLAEALRTEFRIASRIVDSHDYRDGVRATVIERNTRPSWRPARLADVTDADIDAFFADLGADELTFPG